MTELAFPPQRGIVTSLYQCGFYVGSLVAAWATFGTRNYDSLWAWRIPSLLQVAVPATTFVASLLVPESPRYLVSKGRIQEARAIFVQYHAGGDEDSPLVAFEMAEIEQELLLERTARSSTSWFDLSGTKGNRRRLFISVTLGVFSQWCGNGVVSSVSIDSLPNHGLS